MGRKRKATGPVKQASPVAKQPREEQEQEELAIVEEPESDPLATQEQEGDPETADSDDGGGGGGGDDGTGSEWEDKCRQWVVQQEEPETTAPEPLQDDEHDEVAQLTTNALQRPLRIQLKDLTEKQIQNSVMFECEWERCEFESNDDLKFTQHVESHGQRYLAEANETEEGKSKVAAASPAKAKTPKKTKAPQAKGEKKPANPADHPPVAGGLPGWNKQGGLVCYWDLCDFQTSSATELESHVHFHAYHSRIKTYGASLNTCIEIPKCNNESRRRNHIEMYKTAFRCEWGDCNERFNKVVPFFQHLNDHVKDQFPVDRKSTKEIIMCQWTNCTQHYFRRSVALEHIRRHSTERTIGCYNCGSIYTSRLKYIEHCRRQVDYQLREVECPDCDKLFATLQLMKDHRAVHNKRYECPKCPMKWPSQKALTYHIRYRHIVDKPFKCQLCEHRSVSVHDLETHLVRHQTKPVFKCPYTGCVKASKYEVTLQKHIHKDHFGYPMMVYACHLCVKSVVTSAALSHHLIKVHGLEREPGHKRFKYKQDTQTDGKYRLESFLKSRPAEWKPIVDDLQLKKEVAVATVVDSGVARPLPMVADISNVQRYMLCPKVEVGELAKEKRRGRPSKEMDEIVPLWRSKAALKTYSNKAKIRVLKKDEDDFKEHTVTKTDLDEHVITHDDRKTFRCEEYGCNAAYKCQKSLKKHVDMVHYGYRPPTYACHLCKNTYRAGTNLSKHLEKVHRLKRAPGFNRHVYRAGNDGIFRLRTTTEDGVASTSVASATAPKPARGKPRKIVPKPTVMSDDSDDQDDESDYQDLDEGPDPDDDQDQEPETFTSYQIANVQTVSKTSIAIELCPGKELPAPRVANSRRKLLKSETSEPHSPSSPPCPTPSLVLLKEEPRSDSSGSGSASHPAAKNIDDFTVMRRYLKVEKPVVISYEETDAAGSVIRSEMVQTSEISRERLGKNDLN